MKFRLSDPVCCFLGGMTFVLLCTMSGGYNPGTLPRWIYSFPTSIGTPWWLWKAFLLATPAQEGAGNLLYLDGTGDVIHVSRPNTLAPFVFTLRSCLQSRNAAFPNPNASKTKALPGNPVSLFAVMGILLKRWFDERAS